MATVMGTITICFAAVAFLFSSVSLFIKVFCSFAEKNEPAVNSIFWGIAVGMAVLALVWFIVTSFAAMLLVA